MKRINLPLRVPNVRTKILIGSIGMLLRQGTFTNQFLHFLQTTFCTTDVPFGPPLRSPSESSTHVLIHRDLHRIEHVSRQ